MDLNLARALRGYTAQLPKTSRGQFFSCEPGTVSSLPLPRYPRLAHVKRL